MSVQHESVGMGKATERSEAAPELEYRAVSQDSLSMFLAAIDGADIFIHLLDMGF